MNKICTTIEQSKKLIELGIDVDTADMCWTNHLFNAFLSSWRIESTPPQEYKNLLDGFVVRGYLIEPAWSLSALLEMLPEGFLLMDNQGECIPILYSVWVPGFKQSHFWKPNLVDAVFEMVCWLLENEKI